MANPQRGEVNLATHDGVWPMRLTLGVLAELETRLDAGGIIGVAERFESGAFKTDDIIALLTAGLRGAGREIGEAEVAQISFQDGVIGAAKAASDLLELSFRGAP